MTIKNKRTKENYQKILADYIMNNNGMLNNINSQKKNNCFFKNISNNIPYKYTKLKKILILASKNNYKIILNHYFSIWKNKHEINIIENLANEKINNNESNNKNDFKLKTGENNKEKYNSPLINGIDKENGKGIKKDDDEISNENGINIFELKNNNINNSNGNDILKEKENNIADENGLSQNEKNNIIDNQIIEDDLDIKLNEEIIINSKDTFKLKSDIFDSNDMNISLKDKSNVNDITSNISQDKTKNNYKDDITETNNEICNISNTSQKEESNIILNKISENNDNKKDEIKDENILNDISYKTIDNKGKFKEEIRKIFNTNYLFDSLESSIIQNNNLNKFKKKTKKDYLIKHNTNNKLFQIKSKILNHFNTDNTLIENRIHKNKSSKKFFYQISETNNILIEKKPEDINIQNEDKNSFNNTNLTKIENIFIKGNKNDKQINKTVNRTKKQLKLFSIDKNEDLYINKNNKEQNKNYNKVYERIINSNMIDDFLNNSKNEPMFNHKNFSTIQYQDKDNLNINRIIDFSINQSNQDKLNNNYVYERKNNFYLVKHLNIKTNNSNKRICISQRSQRKNYLTLNENELIEPNVQKCPVSLTNQQIFSEARFSNGINNKKNSDIYIKKQNKSFNKIKKKLPKSLSTELISGKIYEKKRKTIYNKNTINSYFYKNRQTNFISEDLLNFIDCIKANKEKETMEKNSVYNFNEIKYNKINTYRRNLNKNKNKQKQNNQKNHNNSSIVDSFKRMYNYKLNDNKDKYMTKENVKNNSIEDVNKNKKVDYLKLNELYLDYKTRDIKKNKLQKEQDINRGITIIPHINKINNKK